MSGVVRTPPKSDMTVVIPSRIKRVAPHSDRSTLASGPPEQIAADPLAPIRMAAEETGPGIADPGTAERGGRDPGRGRAARPLGILGTELEAEARRAVVRPVLGGDEGVLESAVVLTADEPGCAPLVAVVGAGLAARLGEQQRLLAGIYRQMTEGSGTPDGARAPAADLTGGFDRLRSVVRVRLRDADRDREARAVIERKLSGPRAQRCDQRRVPGADLERHGVAALLDGEARRPGLAPTKQHRAGLAEVPRQAADSRSDVAEAAEEEISHHVVHPPNGSLPGGSSSSSRISCPVPSMSSGRGPVRRGGTGGSSQLKGSSGLGRCLGSDGPPGAGRGPGPRRDVPKVHTVSPRAILRRTKRADIARISARVGGIRKISPTMSVRKPGVIRRAPPRITRTPSKTSLCGTRPSVRARLNRIHAARPWCLSRSEPSNASARRRNRVGPSPIALPTWMIT